MPVEFQLLSKNKEDRYQSATGVKYDLELCAKALKEQSVLLLRMLMFSLS